MLFPPLLALALVQATADVAQAGFGLVIASDSDCPSAGAIRAELASLKYPSPDAASVAVHADDDGVSVTFAAPAGVQRGPRMLALAAECPRRASTVALLIAAWLGRMPAGPPPSSSMILEPLPPARAVIEPSRREQTELGVGLSGVVQVGQVIPSLRLELGAGTRGDGTGWQLGAMVPVPGTTRTGPGTVSWVRPALLVARRLRKEVAGLEVDGTMGALVGLTMAWSSGAYPRSDDGLNAGGSIGLRVSTFSGGVGPWIELRGRGWLVQQELAWIGAGGSDSVTLPIFEVELTLGASLPL
jgi:hypothetical protein